LRFNWKNSKFIRPRREQSRKSACRRNFLDKKTRVDYLSVFKFWIDGHFFAANGDFTRYKRIQRVSSASCETEEGDLCCFFFYTFGDINNATGKKNEQNKDKDSQKPSQAKGGKLFYMQKM
jgi:hypothetical protein